MISFLRYFFVVFCLQLALAQGIFGQSELSQNAKISLLTCDPGDELFTVFGHSAIWVFDRERGINTVFNYGTFSFDQPNFYPKFLRGKLLYSLEASEGERFFSVYNYYKRGVRENQLLLDSVEMNRLYFALRENALPQNKDYLYDFFFDNCSTRIADIIEQEVDEVEAVDVSEKTFRNQLHEYLKGLDWTSFGIDLIIGSLADNVASFSRQMFLPDYLQKNLEDTKYSNGQKILSKEKVIIGHPQRNPKSFWITPTILFTILLATEIFILGVSYKGKIVDIYDHLWLVIVGLASVILMFMWFGTDHQACGSNYNLIVFNPLLLLWMLTFHFYSNKTLLRWISFAIVLPMLMLPFIKMSIQNIHSATLLIAIITAMKILRNTNLSSLRKWV